MSVARACICILAVAVVALPAAGPALARTESTHRTAAEPGTYSLYNNYRTFFVAPGGKGVRNIAILGVPITCAPAASAAATTDSLVIASATIRPNGSFVAKGSQTGVFAGVPARFTYSFAGRLTPATAGQPATAAGSYREDIVFRDNVTHRCTSNKQSWTAAKSGPIPQARSLVRPGKYSLYNTYKTFSVTPGRRSMVNIAIGGVVITCTPVATGAAAYDQVVMAQAPVRLDGSFAGRASQSGVFAGAPAKFTYSFTGNFQGPDSNAVTTAAGLLREDIVFTDSAGRHTCTSNTVPWTAVRQAT